MVDRCQFVFGQGSINQVLLGEFRKHWGMHLVEALAIQSPRHPIILLVLVLIPVYGEQMVNVRAGCGLPSLGCFFRDRRLPDQ